MKLRSALLVATVMVAPVAAKAQAVNGLYVGAGLGANFLQNESIDRIRFPNLAGAPTVNTNGKIKFDTGFVGLASVGYGLGNGLRLELEGSYRTNKITRAGGLSAGGDERKYGAMFNVLYDIDPALFGFVPFPINPYVGLGGGYQWAQDQNARIYNNSNPRTLLRTNDGDGNFAYQAIIGAAFPINAVPGLSLTAEYRFMGVLDDRTYHYQYFAPGVSTRANLRQSDDYNHSALLGLRYAFNAAPPPVLAPVAAPMAPTAARTYLVFFDWDRADLTDRARQIIAEAASATTKVQVTRIEVSGHTDTTGTARYNQGLSVRRAQNVAAELVRLGVPRGAITTQGFGFSRPLVSTGPGVREPQNRRVEIVLR
jgi:outer membrane protein OmpA-like peptidoglycan-associated protein